MKYLTYPISIHAGEPPSKIKTILNNVMDYCFYNEAGKFTKELDELYKHAEFIEIAEKKLGIKFSNKIKSLENGKNIYNSIREPAPKTSVSKDLIFEFYEQEKTEFEIVCFLAYCAFRSIIQKQQYTKATNKYLLNRIAGNNSKGGKLPEWLLKYSNEYQLRKIKTELELKFGLKYYSYYTRGFWFSFSMDLSSLIKIAETKRRKFKKKQLAEKKKKAREKALLSLKQYDNHLINDKDHVILSLDQSRN